MNYKHVLWDFDGTLFDTYPSMSKALHDVLCENGINEPADKIQTLAKISMDHAYSYLKQKYNVDDSIVKKYKNQEKIRLMEQALPFEGIAEICREIAENGGFNYLVTHRGGTASVLLEKFGLLEYFRELVTSESNFPRKPSPESILYLVDKYNMDIEKAIMIGDRDIDIGAAIGAGIKSCYFGSNGEVYEKADFNIKEFSELVKIINIGA